MKATEQLKAEHEGIILMLRILTRIANHMEQGTTPNLEELGNLLEFLKIFADRCHHGKEEDLLFPEMEKAGIPKDHGPLGVMLTEHDAGRRFILGMSEAVDQLRSGNSEAISEFVANARDYIGLLSQHIEKENNILFVMADAHLSAEKQNELCELFERLEG